MNPTKAIEILNDAHREPNPDENPDLFDAIKLGIEALKRILSSRNKGLYIRPNKLPGETEE